MFYCFLLKSQKTFFLSFFSFFFVFFVFYEKRMYKFGLKSVMSVPSIFSLFRFKGRRTKDQKKEVILRHMNICCGKHDWYTLINCKQYALLWTRELKLSFFEENWSFLSLFLTSRALPCALTLLPYHFRFRET